MCVEICVQVPRWPNTTKYTLEDIDVVGVVPICLLKILRFPAPPQITKLEDQVARETDAIRQQQSQLRDLRGKLKDANDDVVQLQKEVKLFAMNKVQSVKCWL